MVTKSEVAVHAENTKPLGEVVLLEPLVDVLGAAQLFAVLSPITIDVVHREELVGVLSAACAERTAVGLEDEHPPTATSLASIELDRRLGLLFVAALPAPAA